MGKNKPGGFRSKEIALGGVLLGVNLLLLWLASMGLARFANLYVAVMLPFPLVLREKKGLAWLLWLGTLLLGLLLLPQRGVVVAYGLLGYYLMLRNVLDGRLGRITAFLLKTLWLLVSAMAYLWGTTALLGFDLSAILPEGWVISMPLLVVLGLACSGLAVGFTEWLLSAAAPMVLRFTGGDRG